MIGFEYLRLPGNKDFSFFYLASVSVCLVILRIFVKNMKNMKKISPKKIVSCAGVFVAGLCGSARAEYPYPDCRLLWDRLVYGNDDSSSIRDVNCPIPGIYEELVKKWNEKAGSGEMLSEQAEKAIEKEGFKLFWGGDKKEPKIPCACVDFRFHAYLPQCSDYEMLSSSPIPFGFNKNSENDYYSELPENVQEAIRRCVHIVSSEVFLRKVLGSDYVDAFINECKKKEGNPMLTVKYILYPVGYQRVRGTYLKQGNSRPGELYKNTVDYFGPLHEYLLPRCMDHIVVDMEIYQTHQEIGTKEGKDVKFVKVLNSEYGKYGKDAKTFIDFQLCLKLIFDMKEEKVETVARYGSFIVNKPINSYRENCFDVFFGNPYEYLSPFYGRWFR